MNPADWMVLGMTLCCVCFLLAGAHLRFDLVRMRWMARARAISRPGHSRRRASARR